MKHIASILEHSTGVAAMGAHLDDEASLVGGVTEAQELGLTVDLLTLTCSRASTKNHHQPDWPDFSVADGDRTHEGRVAARQLGVRHFDILDGQDGALARDSFRLAKHVGRLLAARETSHLLVMGVEDHPDHLAAHTIAQLAAAGLAQALWTPRPHAVDVLTVRSGSGGGQVVAPTSPAVQARAFAVLSAHRSQFRFSPVSRPGWWRTPHGEYLHPDDAASLQPYPLLRAAHYDYTPATTTVTAGAHTAILIP